MNKKLFEKFKFPAFLFRSLLKKRKMKNLRKDLFVKFDQNI